jgi:hypothetical protein
MRKCIVVLAAWLSVLSCGKSGGSSPVPEPAVVFTIDAVNNSTAQGSSFPVLVTLTSAMPSQGIKLDATLVDQTNNNSIAQISVNSSTAKFTYTFTGLVQQHWCTATIKVSSVSTPSNSASQSFTVVYK